MSAILDHLQTVKPGDEISIVLAGMILDGVFQELADNYIVVKEATSPSVKKKSYTLKIPIDNIYAWGTRDKKKKKK